MTRILWVGLSTFAAVVAATAVQAQTLLAADEIRGVPVPEDSVVIGRGPYAAMPPGVYGRYDETIPPFEVARILRASGFQPLGVPVRRRSVYMVSAIDAEGYDGRVVLDAYTGRIMRFVPAEAGDDMAEAYGPAGALPPPSPPPVIGARPSLRPPAAIPRVAGRTPAAVGQPAPRRIDAPPQQQAAAAATTERSRPGSETAARAAPASTPTPQTPVLQPTQPMPPVQGLE